MTKKFPGGFITKSPTAPSSSAATGIWTLEQAAQYKQASAWPTPPAPGPSPGGLWVAGINSLGGLGLNDTIARSSPTQVGALATWVQSSYYNATHFGLKSDGTLWSWGANNNGQGGFNSKAVYFRSSPAQVGALTNWKSITYAGGIKTDGTLWTWGWNTAGQCGLNNTIARSSPTQVGALTNWSVAIRAFRFMFAMKTDGTLWSWGGNNYGELGQNNRTALSSPVQIGALTTWSYIGAACTYNCFAIKTDGTLWSWGSNYGALGQNDNVKRSSPTQVGALTNWSKVAGSIRFGARAIKTDGTLWSWGLNDYGQVGDNTTITRSSPVQIGSLTSWASVNQGGALKTDGTLWVWGLNNSDGGLGINSLANASSPTQVAGTTWQQKDPSNIIRFFSFVKT